MYKKKNQKISIFDRLLQHIYSQWLIVNKLGSLAGESLGMANDGKRRTGQYIVERVKVIKCFHPRMLTPPMGRVNTNGTLISFAFLVFTKIAF